MLRAEKFSGSKSEILAAAECFNRTLARSITRTFGADDDSFSGSFQTRKKSKQVLVQFFDTKDRRLRDSSLVFRQRQSLDGGSLELTLKRRHPDRFFVSGSRIDGETKMEEDIQSTNNHPFLSLYSLSGKVADVPDDTRFRELRDIRAFYQHVKKQMGDSYEGGEKLLRVCDFTARQTVLEGVRIRFSKRIQANCALIIWHEANRDQSLPGVVEFSFRYRDRKSGRNREPFTAATAGRAYDLLQALRDIDGPMASWIDPASHTKTAFAYSRTRN